MKHDIVIIGSGRSDGAGRSRQAGALDCAIVENAKFRGTCLTKGCILKMLVYPADLIREIETADRIGVHAGRPQIDWETVSGRMWEQIGFDQKIEGYLKKIPNLTVYKGTGSFAGPNSMAIRYGGGRPEDLIHGEKFVIAAGTDLVPPFPDWRMRAM